MELLKLKNEQEESLDAMCATQVLGAEENKGSVRVVSGSGFRYVIPFPWRLHQMLEEVEKSGDDTIASWLPDGEHFLVHNPQAFVQKIIPKFFKQKSYKSFQRQLHLYGFQRVLEGPNRGAYFHESFLKKDRKLALDITRIKAPKRRRPLLQKSTVETSLTNVIMLQTPESSIMQSVSSEIPMMTSSGVARLRDSFEQFRETQNNYSAPPQMVKSEVCDIVPSFNQIGEYGHSNGQTFVPQSLPRLQRESSNGSASETCDWLINAGVPLSAFDPVAIDNQACQPPAAADLIECANEIRDLFCCTPVPSEKHVPQVETSLSSFLQSDSREPNDANSLNENNFDFGDLESFQFY